MADRMLTIYFTDSTKLSFDFPKQVDNPNYVAKRLEKMIENQQLMIEADGVLFMFPWQNIKHIQAAPAPDADDLPDTVITGAKLVD